MTQFPVYHPKTFSLKAYRAATSLLQPVAEMALRRRLKRGKEDPDRIDERRGITHHPRPDGTLIWIHGASVGESLSILPLIDRLIKERPYASILVTTGTVTSAAMMAERLPKNVIHQYAPVDHPEYVARFFKHWQPDVGLFVESELWPSLIGTAQALNIPLALINGRLSPKSYKSWQRRPKAAIELLNAFVVITAQDADNGARLSDLSGRDALCLGNLKRAAPALPTNETALTDLRRAIGNRPVWLAASTHPGEEELILQTHKQLTDEMPNLLTVIAPRHPQRGDEIATLITEHGLSLEQRSKNVLPHEKTNIYLADTLGELGVFFRLSDVAFIGGSLLPVGGHNPMEPARLGTAIVTGPHVFNFMETFDSMRKAGGLALVRNERDLSASLIRLLSDKRTRDQMAKNAQNWADKGGQEVLDNIVDALGPVMPAKEGQS